jgi:hypothetical protein
MGDPTGEGKGGVAPNEPLLVPWREQGCHVIDFLAVVFLEWRHEHHLLKHVVRWVVLGPEERERGVADEAVSVAGLQKPGHFLRLPSADERLPLILGSRVLELSPRLQERRSDWKTRGLVFGHCHRVTGHEIETRRILGNPFIKPVGVELIDVLGNLSEAQVSPVFISWVPRHFCHQSGGCGNLKISQRSALRVEVIEGQIAVRLDHNGSATLRLCPDPVGKPLLDDEGEVVIGVALRKQVAYEGGLPRAGHAEQDRAPVELRRRWAFVSPRFRGASYPPGAPVTMPTMV